MLQEIIKTGYAAGKGNLDDKKRIGSVYHNLGIVNGILNVEAAIGRALMSRPRLLVLDEPSMGLAPLVVQSIFGTLKTLNVKEGLSILVAEQNSTVAFRYADRATVLENGVAVLEGPAVELRQRAESRPSTSANPHRAPRSTPDKGWARPAA